MKIAAQPWYREPWPWILMAGPALVIFAGVITVWLAIKSNDGLVVDDYYKQGLEVNQVIERDRKSEALGLAADVFLGNNGQVRVLLNSTVGAALPQKLKLRISHPTRSGFDQQILLASEAQGAYSGNLQRSLEGGNRWLIRLEDEESSWRLSADWLLEKYDSLHMTASAAVTSSNR